MGRCEGLSVIALISLLILGLQVFACLYLFPERKSTFCFDFRSSTSGYNVVAIVASILFLIYYIFYVVPVCMF